MKLIIMTPSKKVLEQEIDFLVVRNEDGETGILDKHIPTILTIGEGYIRFDSNSKSKYACVEEGIVEFKDHVATIMAIEAVLGDTLEEASANYESYHKARLAQMKKDTVDYSKLERELRENISKSKAGQV